MLADGETKLNKAAVKSSSLMEAGLKRVMKAKLFQDVAVSDPVDRCTGYNRAPDKSTGPIIMAAIHCTPTVLQTL